MTGLGDFWKLDSASPEDLHREAAAEWVAAAPVYVADLVGQIDSVRSYSRSVAAHLLLAEMPDPQGAGLSPDEAWGLVRLRAFELAATSTDSAIVRWARTFAGEFAVQEASAVAAVGGSGRSVVAVSQLPDFLKLGESGTAVLFGERWGVKDHGELLAVGGDEPERAKCLYLSIAAALKMDPAELLSALRARARRFRRRKRVSSFPKRSCVRSSWRMTSSSGITRRCGRRCSGSVTSCSRRFSSTSFA